MGEAVVHLGATYEVWIPYAKSLSKHIETMRVLQRRGFKLLDAIKNVAIMRQASRERDHRGHVVATLRDHTIARELLNNPLSPGIDATVSKETRETVTGSRKTHG